MAWHGIIVATSYVKKELFGFAVETSKTRGLYMWTKVSLYFFLSGATSLLSCAALPPHGLPVWTRLIFEDGRG